jgi:TM2 domain-containing membrane protein YozV
MQTINIPQKSFTTTLLLSVFLGGLGVDRFYLGKVSTGLLKLAVSIFTLGLFGWVWWLVDIILIASGSMRDAYGRELVK